MNAAENIFVCLASPLLLAVLCLRGARRRMLLFFLCGMSACLLSSYISAFLAISSGMDSFLASLEISPIVEESMKLFPFLFYLLVFEPENDYAAGSMLMIAAGFATFENVCWLLANGASDLPHLLIRGLCTGAMHITAGTISSIGLVSLWNRLYMRAVGTLGLLSLSVTFHAVYNILVSQAAPVSVFGYALPILTAGLLLAFAGKKLVRIDSV